MGIMREVIFSSPTLINTSLVHKGLVYSYVYRGPNFDKLKDLTSILLNLLPQRTEYVLAWQILLGTMLNL
jgi:hypothetical protein